MEEIYFLADRSDLNPNLLGPAESPNTSSGHVKKAKILMEEGEMGPAINWVMWHYTTCEGHSHTARLNNLQRQACLRLFGDFREFATKILADNKVHQTRHGDAHLLG